MVTDWGTAIFNSLSNAANLILTFIPRIIGFLVIVLVGWIVGTLLGKGLTLVLRRVGFDRLANRIGLNRFEQRMGVTLDPAGVLGKVVFWFIFLIFLIPAFDSLGLPTVSNVLNTLVAYIPNVFVAIVVLFLGTLAATFVADLVRGATASANIGNSSLFAGIARWAIIIFAALIALDQLRVAPDLVIVLFGAAVFGAALAFGLAFGLGGQDAARRWLARVENTVSNAASQASAHQANVAQMQENQMPAYQQPVPVEAYQQPDTTQQQPGAPQQPYPPQYPDTTEPMPPDDRPTQR